VIAGFAPNRLLLHVHARACNFQDAYCRVLVRYKEELSRPFDEAASFLSSIQEQLSNLCSGGSSPAATTATHSGKETRRAHGWICSCLS
jgi:hypothetical protein